MSFPGKLAPFLPLGGIPPRFPLQPSGEYNPPPSVPHMDGKRAAPRKGRRVVFFGGVCTCRAGPMCPAAGYAFFGGARGPRPTGRYVEPRVGDGVPTSHQCGGAALLGPLWEGAVGAADWGREKRVASLPPSALRADTSLAEGDKGRRIPTPVFALARNDRKHRRAARHARRVRSFIYWSRGGIYRATMWRRKLVSGDLRAGAGAGNPDRRRVSGGVPDVSGGVSADRLRRGVLA